MLKETAPRVRRVAIMFYSGSMAQQFRQLGDVGGDAPGPVAGELGPRLGTGETMRRRELIALMGARRRIRMDEGRIAEQHLIGPGPRSTENG
jgi:hypothetical protein